MASNQDLLDAVAAGKAEVLAAVEAEKVETQADLAAKQAVLQTRITELEAIIAAGGTPADTQPAIDAVKAANAEVLTAIQGITVATPPPTARRR